MCISFVQLASQWSENSQKCVYLVAAKRNINSFKFWRMKYMHFSAFCQTLLQRAYVVVKRMYLHPCLCLSLILTQGCISLMCRRYWNNVRQYLYHVNHIWSPLIQRERVNMAERKVTVLKGDFLYCGENIAHLKDIWTLSSRTVPPPMPHSICVWHRE